MHAETVPSTPIAPARATPRQTPLTGDRVVEAKSHPVQYSASPLCTIDSNSLPASRFLVPARRRLAYRDTMGRVNVHLCQRSLAESDPADGAEALAKLSAWERHARRAIASRPSDENLTVDEMLQEVERQEKEENERLPISLRKPRRSGSSPSTPAATVLAPRPTTRLSREADLFEGDSAESEDSGDGRLASSTVLMQRRLFRAPRIDDEPAADTLYLRTLAARRGRRASASPSEEDEEDDVWEVERVLKEDAPTRRFLIRWAGFGPQSDSWEPEENVSTDLVEAFRRRRALEATNAGDDFSLDRSRMLWCKACECHRPSDSFSASQRRHGPAARTCLNHHYGIGAPLTPSAGVKRGRDAAEQSPMAPPPKPSKRPALLGSLGSRPSAVRVPEILRRCQRGALSL